MVNVGDVLWLFAGTIRDPKMKMHACVYVDDGIFFRINSKSHFPGSILITQEEHPFLKWDSYLECGGPIEFDVSEIEESFEREWGVAGQLSDKALQEMGSHIETVRQLTRAEKQKFKDSIRRECERRGI
ncbi:MAG: hypothetical protein H8E30_14515 [Alphaproteobacteria bacterium]|nr:hypothetical protein [Alphaproteobacteria bacterium]